MNADNFFLDEKAYHAYLNRQAAVWDYNSGVNAARKEGFNNGFDKELYKSRNIIERFFQRIKNYRHVATRYDKLSNCFLNFIILAAVMIQI